MSTGAGELRGVIVQNGVRRWDRRVELKVQALRGEVDGFVRTESIRRWKALLGARQRALQCSLEVALNPNRKSISTSMNRRWRSGTMSCANSSSNRMACV
jgi:hypothetical protein